jgi:hypothetical protein
MELPLCYASGACNFGMAIIFLNNLRNPGLDPQVLNSRMVFRPDYLLYAPCILDITPVLAFYSLTNSIRRRIQVTNCALLL